MKNAFGIDGACAMPSWRSGKDAVGILFDFAHAFPSLAPVWMFMVVRRMAVSDRLAFLIDGDNAIVLEVAGNPVAEVSV